MPMAKPPSSADQIKRMASSIIGKEDFQPAPDSDDDSMSDSDPQGRISEQQAGYLELGGAQKDSDCTKVAVQGGISSQMGCCNIFDPAEGAQTFSCGTCEYVRNSNEAIQQRQ